MDRIAGERVDVVLEQGEHATVTFLGPKCASGKGLAIVDRRKLVGRRRLLVRSPWQE